MSESKVPEKVTIRLWGKAAGRCEYEGCNLPLWRDHLTKAEFNSAYVAHIISDRVRGPRGHPTLSKKLACDISNLMLLCDTHHRLIDKEDVAAHTVERLRAMKAAHEHRIEAVTAITLDRQSHVLLYGANIGALSSPTSYQQACDAMLPNWYPAEATPISLGMVNSSFRDTSPEFWAIEAAHLKEMVDLQLRPRLAQGTIKHLSVFALAPQPLLISLGYWLSDLAATEVYQYHREPQPRNWRWQDSPEDFDYIVVEPADIKAEPALAISLSGTIAPERITAVMGQDVSFWQLTIRQPDNDFLKSQQQAQQFRTHVRCLLDRIKIRHGRTSTLHIFPCMPVALAVELGRVIMPKADLRMRIYDENAALGGFVRALELPIGTGQ